MVMEKVGVDLITYADNRLPGRLARSDKQILASNKYLRDVLVITKKGIEVIRALHAHGIIHGDIHPGNFAFKSMDFQTVDDAKLILIDLGMAEFFPYEYGMNPRRALSLVVSPAHQTVSRLKGMRPGRCDDVIRTIEQIVVLLGDSELIDAFVRDYKIDPRNSVIGKEQVPWFQSSLDFLDYSPSMKAQVQQHLDSLRSRTMRACTSPDVEPPYDDVIRRLDSLITPLDALIQQESLKLRNNMIP